MSIRERMAVAACDFADCRKAGTCVPGPISLCGSLARADRCLAASGRAELVEAIRAVVRMVDDIRDNTEGQWPDPDSGCLDCTAGTTPDKYNTGPCAYHAAISLLRRIEADQ